LGITNNLNDETVRAGQDRLIYLRWNSCLTGLYLLGAQRMDRKTVDKFINTLEKVETQNNISDTPGNIYNFDESGIQINTNLAQ
jgi:hypothetical protein